MIRPILAASLAGAIALSGVAAAQDGATLALAATCATCHGPNGHSQGAIPSLAGRPQARLQAALNDMIEGRRPATIMLKVLAGYRPDEVDAALAWFSRQPPPPATAP
ncbi:MAG: c-type cytochrome [Zoogloeaceae bacterium]|nr:c-type cytochrome [Zoogloeaceae bacterium]